MPAEEAAGLGDVHARQAGAFRRQQKQLALAMGQSRPHILGVIHRGYLGREKIRVQGGDDQALGLALGIGQESGQGDDSDTLPVLEGKGDIKGAEVRGLARGGAWEINSP